jgi:hypothetical protein
MEYTLLTMIGTAETYTILSVSENMKHKKVKLSLCLTN